MIKLCNRYSSFIKIIAFRILHNYLSSIRLIIDLLNNIAFIWTILKERLNIRQLINFDNFIKNIYAQIIIKHN